MAQATKTIEGQMYEVRKYGFITFETREEMEEFLTAGNDWGYALSAHRSAFGWIVTDEDE